MPLNLRMRKLVVIGSILAALAAVVYWPANDSGVPGAKRLSAEQMRNLPAGQESDRLIGEHIACLIYGFDGVGSAAGLPAEARHVWATLSFESRTAAGLKYYFALPVDVPLAETAAAYRAMDATDAAVLVEQIAKLNNSSRPEALSAMESRLATAKAKAAEKRLAYVIEHAEEIASER